MRPFLITAGAVTRRRQPGGGGGSQIVFSANTGADFNTVQNEGMRSSGGSNVAGGTWEPGVNSDTMLWRPSANFNTSSIPNPITGATFRIYMFEQFGASVVNVHENLRAWQTISWTHYDIGGSLAWTTPGGTGSGDRSASTIGSQSTPASNGVWIEIELDPAVVEAWRQAGAAPANGIQLRGDGQYSSYHTNAGTNGFRPELVLRFD
jgi:hypothetical protein